MPQTPNRNPDNGQVPQGFYVNVDPSSGPMITRITPAQPVQVPMYSCDDCSEDVPRDETIRARYGRICNSCYENHCFECENCGDIHHTDERSEDNENECNACNGGSDVRYRHVVIPADISSSAEGEILKHVRAIGVELEARVDDNSDINKIAKELPKEFGIEYDGSITDNGVEVQTPPLMGKDAEKAIKLACDKINEHGGYVDESCGYHLHIDVREIDRMSAQHQFAAMQHIWLMYIAFEDVILSLLPESRRKNGYCLQLKRDYHLKEIAEAENIDGLEKIWYRARTSSSVNSAKSDKKHSSRYRGINMHTLFTERHIEIRYHTGTLNTKKILEWAELHCAIVNYVLNAVLNSWDLHDTVGKMIDETNGNEKTRKLFSIIGLTSSTRDYFYARQSQFMPKPKAPETTAAFKEAATLLASEQE